jgi:hypothetical protein
MRATPVVCDSGNHFPDRRLRVRLKLRWPVCFFEDTHEIAHATTVNISSNGFYCLSEVPLTPGQVVSCVVGVPAHDPSEPERTNALKCQVRIVRVTEHVAEQRFGIGCRIEDYRLFPISSLKAGRVRWMNGYYGNGIVAGASFE